MASSDTTQSRPAFRTRFFTGLGLPAVVAALSLLLVAGVALAFQMAYADRVYPGVTVSGVDVGGRSSQEASVLIQQRLDTYASTRLTLRQANQTWTPTAAELGLRYDASGSAAAALAVGRYGNLLQRLSDQISTMVSGHEVHPFVSVDQTQTTATISGYSDAILRNPVNSALEFKPDGTVAVTAAKAGVALDVETSIGLARANLLALSTDEIALATTVVPVPLSDTELQKGRSRAESIVGKPLAIVGEGKTWTLEPRELVGLLSVSDKGTSLDVSVDATKVTPLVEKMGSEIYREPVDATVRMDGTNAVIVPGQDGRTIDVAASVKAIQDQAETKRSIALVVNHTVGLGAKELEPLQSKVSALLKTPSVFRYGDKAWTLPPAELAAAITFKRGGSGSVPTLDLNTERLAPMMATISKDLNRKPKDAQLRFKGGKVVVTQDSVDGITVDGAATMAAASKALSAPGSAIAVQVTVTKPAVSNADAAKLSFDEFVSDASTNFAGAISQKVHNIKLAASRLDGTVVAPGAEFSFNEALGPATISSGFQYGYGIYLNSKGEMQTVQSEAGGICQVATTLFQSVFWAGYPITERNTHMYWIAKYGAPPRGLRGLDATVDEAYDVDFRFKNNTENWIAIQAGAEGTTLRFVLWGVKPDWAVKVSEPKVSNWVAANRALVKEPDPTMPPGWSLYVEAPEDGFEVAIDRTVTKGDKVIDQWTAKARYRPSRNVMLVGVKGVDLTKVPFNSYANSPTPGAPGTGTPGAGTPQATPGPGTPQATPQPTTPQPTPTAGSPQPTAPKPPPTATKPQPTAAKPAATPAPAPTKKP